MKPEGGQNVPSPEASDRRGFLARASSALMLGGLAASYGTLGYMAARFVYPARGRRTAWLFVTEVRKLPQGGSLTWRSPAGHRVNVTRQGAAETAGDFVALSSVCPHLGCHVHWEAHQNRFFCPCHNGVFDPSGRAIEGPPAKAGQSLLRFPVKVEGGLLFIEVPVEVLALGPGEVEAEGCPRSRPGHDPCLDPRRPA